jgi:hypothetical protein
MLLFIICFILIFILYRAYEYYKKQNKEMFKLLLQFVKPYYEQDDIKYSRPIIEYIDEKGFTQKIIYDKSKFL